MRDIAWLEVAQVDELPQGSAKRIEVEGEDIALYHLDGTFYATADLCTHAQASLAEGTLLEGEHTVVCPLHGGRFDLTTGKAVRLPAFRPVRTYPVRVEGTKILIER